MGAVIGRLRSEIMNITLRKILQNKLNLIFILAFALAFFVRLYNFSNRVSFWTEQAQSLIVSTNYLSKPSLLGQEFYRTDSRGHIIFAGADFNYALVPLILLFRGDPILITSAFAFLNLITGLMIYIITGKLFNKTIALFSSVIFLFNDLMIYHSLFIWIYNPLPLIGLFILYAVIKRKNIWTGFLSGLAFSLQIMFAAFVLPILGMVILRAKNKVKAVILFLAGAVVADLPMVLFDIKHKFYETITIFQYFLDTLRGRSDATFNYYYFLFLWPIFAIVAGVFIYSIWKKSKAAAYGLLGVYFIANLTSTKLNWTGPNGANGIKVNEIKLASEQIAKNAPEKFNVASVLDFDKRAYVLRYFVQYKYGKTPEGVENYPNSKELYVLAPNKFDYKGSNIWEIKVGGPYDVTKLTDVGANYQISKLQYCQKCK